MDLDKLPQSTDDEIDENKEYFFVVLQLGNCEYEGTMYWVEDRLDPSNYKENLESILSEVFIQRYGFVKIIYTFYQKPFPSYYGYFNGVLPLAVAQMARLFGIMNVGCRPCSGTCYPDIERLMNRFIDLDYYDEKEVMDQGEKSCLLCKGPITEEDKRKSYRMPVLDLSRCLPNCGYRDQGRVYLYKYFCHKCDDEESDIRKECPRGQWTTEGYIEVNPQTNRPVKSYHEREKERRKNIEKKMMKKLQESIDAWIG